MAEYYIKQSIEEAIKKSYEHSHFNEEYFWDHLKQKQEKNIFAEGYRYGMRTSFVFIKKYCTDLLDFYEDVEKFIKKHEDDINGKS